MYQVYSIVNEAGTVRVGIERCVLGAEDIGVIDGGVIEIGVNEGIVIDGGGGTDGPELNAVQSRFAQQPCIPSKITQ